MYIPTQVSFDLETGESALRVEARSEQARNVTAAREREAYVFKVGLQTETHGLEDRATGRWYDISIPRSAPGLERVKEPLTRAFSLDIMSLGQMNPEEDNA